ncbi:translation initiation factor IF-2 subunit alpha [Candidatus Woesearchaeota archaeon]|nr:MAG: translation initiation factor IF-2 subunit alpha [Candidatus Woesearchaeota archaeon]
MDLQKKGYPEEDELVLCTVTAINPYSVFVTLDEYGGRTALIHISEVSPGRIRNIRDYVKEGKKIVCKVLRINKEKGHIDLSLRRVNESQKRIKLDEIKKQQLSEKIIEQAAKKNKKDPKKTLTEVAEKILKKYDSIFEAFELVVQGQLDLSKIVDKKLAADLTELIKQRISPPHVKVKGVITMTTPAENGIEQIKKLAKICEKTGATVKYAGGGTYNLELIDENYKSAEKKLKKALTEAETFAHKNKINFKFERTEE